MYVNTNLALQHPPNADHQMLRHHFAPFTTKHFIRTYPPKLETTTQHPIYQKHSFQQLFKQKQTKNQHFHAQKQTKIQKQYCHLQQVMCLHLHIGKGHCLEQHHIPLFSSQCQVKKPSMFPFHRLELHFKNLQPYKTTQMG